MWFVGGDDQVRGIETVTTYDPATQEFVIDTPCESAQKYWIGGAAKVTNQPLTTTQIVLD
jgi:acyl-CoA oxidase